MKRISRVGFLFVISSLLPTFVFSVSLDGIVKRAIEESEDYKSGKISLSYSKLGADRDWYSDKSSFSFGIKNAAVYPDTNFTANGTAFMDYKSGGDDEFALSLEMGGDYSSADGKINLNPSIKLAKTININGVKSLSQKLSIEKSYLVADYNAQSYDLKFEKRIYKAIQSCVQAQSALIKAQANYDNALSLYNADAALEVFTEGTSTQLGRKSSLIAAELSLKNAKISYDTSLGAFENTAGFEYQELGFDDIYEFDKIDEYLNFDFEIKESGNTSCQSKKYDMLIAQNEYERVKGGGEKLKGELNTGYAFDINSDNPNRALNADIHMNLSAPIYNLRFGGGSFYKNDSVVSPYIDLSFSISPDKSYALDKIAREQKGLDYQRAVLDYSLAIGEYFNSAYDTKQTILNLKNSYRSALSQFEYAHLQYENSKELSALGYRSVNEKKSDEVAFLEAKNNYIQSILNLVVNVIDAKIFNM